MILLLGGTSDSRALLEMLEARREDVLFSACSPYGLKMVAGSSCRKHAGALNREAMTRLCEENHVDLIADATHPYADQASITGLAVSRQLGIPYVRYVRAGSDFPEDAMGFEAEEDLIEALGDFLGEDDRVLLTTGSKNLAHFVPLGCERIIARVLPASGVLEKCERLGFSPANLIAQQGPFSKEENLAHIHRYGVKALVMKDSGDAGGSKEKIDAAVEAGVRIFYLKRPEVDPVYCETDLESAADRIVRERRRCPAIMLQGTGSSVGKSLLCAGLCRAFSNRGLKPYPFKPQNMALNSFITKEGLEMGRAQVTQAKCARLEPIADMNPILLKPNSDMGSQLILRGKVAANTKAREYYSLKPALLAEARDAYANLCRKADIMVVEGAGSPAEINLRDSDVANMGFATEEKIPVLLVADIDKGGVFASLLGTVMLLDEHDRAMIRGFVVNKFRGDVSLLEGGIREIEEKMGIPCLGIMPMLDVHIDDEDSVSDRLVSKNREASLHIGVVGLRHLSNFTDLTCFDMYEDVAVDYYRDPQALLDAEMDLLILPGSKNTIDDMEKLEVSGMADAIRKKAESVPVIGICGGYQLLGREIRDPHQVESTLGSIEGLGLLEITTTLLDEKHTTQTAGSSIETGFIGLADGSPLEGYEIHMGKTERAPGLMPFVELADGTTDGAVSGDGRVIGTYLHGIFDNDNFREALLGTLAARKGVVFNPAAGRRYEDFQEEEFEKLAQAVEEHLDVDRILRITGLR